MTKAKAEPNNEKPKPRIKHLRGKTRILVIAPHGVMGDDDYTDIIAETLNEKFDCFAVINKGFRRPDEEKGETSDLDNFVLDLGRISDGDQLRSPHTGTPHDEDFFGWIDSFLAEIAMNHGEPFVVHIHGIDTDNIEQVALTTTYKKKPDDLHVLLGYGQRKPEEPKTLTAEKKTVDDLIKNLSTEGVNAIEAPVDSLYIKGKWRRYCGSEKDVLNQYFGNQGTNGQSIQLEIKESPFRDNPEIAHKTADSLANAIGPLAGLVFATEKDEKNAEAPSVSAGKAAPPAWAEVRTTLSEKSKERRISVKEIDLSDTRFKSRVQEYGLDEKKFKELMASIAYEGILNNLILREVAGRDKYQVISGFRRLAALEKVYEEQGRKGELPEAEVPARIFSSLTDDEALRISFSENLARKDLTLWEIANYCRIIAEEHEKQDKPQGEIEKHLAEIIRKDERTVRRYLALSAINNESIRRDLHSGSMDASIGNVFTRRGLTEKGREALYGFYRRFPNPLSFDSFDRLSKNALTLSEWSELKVEKILSMKTASDFLAIPPDDLKERTEYLMKIRNEPPAQILAHEIGDLKSPLARVMSRNELAPFAEKFSDKASIITTRISDTLKSKKKRGEVAISPVGVLKDKTVKLTITAPVSDVQKVVQFTLEELKGEIDSLENLFEKPLKPKPRKEEIRAKERFKIDKNATIAFTIRLKRLQDILKDLARDGLPTEEEDSRGRILFRAASDNKVELGRHCNNGLLIPSEAEILRKEAAVLLLRPIYTPIIKLAAKNDTACDVQIVPAPGKSSPAESTFRLQVQDTSYTWNIPSFSPDELCKFFDKKRKVDTTVEMEASDLKHMLGKVTECIEPREVLTALTGIFFKMDQKDLRLTGTDGIRLFEVTKPHGGMSGTAKEVLVLVPFRTGSLLRALLKNDTGAVKMGVSRQAVSFEFNGVSLNGEPIRDYKYPNYSSIFEKVESSFSIPIRKLREIASNLSIVSDPEDNHRLTLRAEKNLISFGNGKGSTEYSAIHADGALDIDVNAMFLLDLARSMDGEEVEVRVCTTEKGSKGLTFHPDDGRQRAFLAEIKRWEPEKPQEKGQQNRSNSKTERTDENTVGGTYGTREWAVRSVNCCDGCSHDCLYCYAKFMAARRPKNRVPKERWKEERIRQKNVDKDYRYKEGRTMFPSSHDITPGNFDACFTVLRKLLESGNGVIVVLKPHLEIVKRLCGELKEFKEKILFRFTITATDDRTLSFWEPNAPLYEERKASLKHAFDAGFSTSVSVEPMLGSEKIDDLVKDLSPFVNDAIWIGKMNHIGRIDTSGDGVKAEIERIKAGQTDEKIWAIYNLYKDNPKIKWKDSIKKVVGIETPPAAGMDI